MLQFQGSTIRTQSKKELEPHMSRNGRYLFTSESVTEGHPDKIAEKR